MRVQHGTVIASAERVADLAQRTFRKLSREIHRDLAGESDVGGAALARHVSKANVEMLGYALLDLIDRDRAARFFLQDVFEEMLDLLKCRLLSTERGI